MVFFSNLLISLLYSYYIEKYYPSTNRTNNSWIILYSPLILYWLFICGGQFYVGTDYSSYYDIFNGITLELYKEKGEFLFYYIVKFFNIIEIKGQFLFYLFYSINFFIFFYIVQKLKLKNPFIFILIFITVTSLYNNQLNILRQAISIFIGTLGVIYLAEKDVRKYFFFSLISMLFHMSGVLFFVFCLVTRKKIKTILFISLFLIAFLFSMYDGLLEYLISLPVDTILPISYIGHLQSGEIEERNLLSKFTKYIFIPLYLMSLFKLKNMNLPSSPLFLYNVGFLSFCFRISVLNFTIIARLSDTFLLLSGFPLYYYFEFLYEAKNKLKFTVFVVGLITIYFIKTVIFPNGEYLYKSIYFQ